MSAITFGSVCSGIEAASVAWHPLGWRAAWLAEIESNPSATLAHHYPDVPNLGDMNRIPQLLRNGEITAPDVFCGGTPCQAFSVAGLRNSLDDARGNLSLKFCDIANEIDIQRAAAGLLPCIIKWENVPGVLSTKDNAFGCFLGQLAGEDCPLEPPGGKWSNAGAVLGPQRAIAWRILDAQYFGVAQRRKRVFVVASARDGFDPAAVLFEFEGVRRDSAPRREAREEIAGGFEIGPSGGRLTDVTPTLDCRAKNGPVQNQIGAGVLVPVAVDLRNLALNEHVTQTLQAGQHAPDPSGTPHLLQPIAFSCKDYGADASLDLAPTMRAMGHAGSHPNAGGQLAVAFAENSRGEVRLEGGDGSRTGALSTGGGKPGQGTPCVAVCVTGDITHTLKAEGFDASEGGTGRGQPIVPVAFDARQDCVSSFDVFGALGSSSPQAQAVAYRHAEPRPIWRVRRLTPKECERLQGFPDDYTLVPVRGKPAADGPRYKALGNSWAVPVVRWIGRRIDAALRAQMLEAA